MPDLDPTPGYRRARRPAPLLLLPLLFGACASAPPSPPPDEASAAAVQAAAETAASAEGPAAEAPVDQARLDKAVAGFGGAERIDGLRTLVVESTMTRIPEGGQQTTIRQRSYVAFPDRFRREAILEGMTVASAVGPAGAFVVSPLGILPLPEEERAAMVHGFARTPLSLLRNRDSEAFSATAAGEGELDGAPVEYLEIVSDGDHHRLALDPETGQVQEIRFTTQPSTAPDTEATAETADGTETAGEAETGDEAKTEAATDDEAPAESEAAEGDASEPGEVVIRYADHREVDGLVYPFRSTTTSEGQPTITRVVDSLQVDTELDPALFEPPPAPPEGLLPPDNPETPPQAPDGAE